MGDRRSIILTGGGTAGHVNPHFALIPLLRKRNWEIEYIGSSGIERELVEKFGGVPFRTIAAGKLRRYFDLKNFTDLARIVVGFLQCIFIMLHHRPTIVFSKGGFVSVPVAWAAWVLRIPIVTHESDMTPGLATKLMGPVAKKVLHTFEETAKFLPSDKAVWTGTPIRDELLTGEAARGAELCGFPKEKTLPVLLVMGGSQGAQRINDCLAEVLPHLVADFRIIHISGKGKGINFKHPNYKSFEYVLDDLKHLFAVCDAVISRAGANAIFEFLALKRPMLLIPLEIGSRGDQVKNAASFAAQGWARVLRETAMTPEQLRSEISSMMLEKSKILAAQSRAPSAEAALKVVSILESDLR